MSALRSMVALCRAADAHEMARDIAAIGAARQVRTLARRVRKDAPYVVRPAGRSGLVIDFEGSYGRFDGTGRFPRSRRAQRLAGFVR